MLMDLTILEEGERKKEKEYYEIINNFLVSLATQFMVLIPRLQNSRCKGDLTDPCVSSGCAVSAEEQARAPASLFLPPSVTLPSCPPFRSLFFFFLSYILLQHMILLSLFKILKLSKLYCFLYNFAFFLPLINRKL